MSENYGDLLNDSHYEFEDNSNDITFDLGKEKYTPFYHQLYNLCMFLTDPISVFI